LRIGQMHAVDHKSLDKCQMVHTCPYEDIKWQNEQQFKVEPGDTMSLSTSTVYLLVLTKKCDAWNKQEAWHWEPF
jgi:hypothetical protein